MTTLLVIIGVLLVICIGLVLVVRSNVNTIAKLEEGIDAANRARNNDHLIMAAKVAELEKQLKISNTPVTVEDAYKGLKGGNNAT